MPLTTHQPIQVQHTSPPGGLATAFARIPLPAVAAMLVVGAVLADVHVFALMGEDSTAPPQWIGRLLQIYFFLIPLAVLALWARRSTTLGRLGRVGAWLVVPQLVAYWIVTGTVLVRSLVLGRAGDLEGPVIELEWFVTLFYLGTVLVGIAYLLDSGAPRAIGALLLGGFVLSFFAPFGLTLAMVLLAGVVLRTRLARRAPHARASAGAR